MSTSEEPETQTDAEPVDPVEGADEPGPAPLPDEPEPKLDDEARSGPYLDPDAEE